MFKKIIKVLLCFLLLFSFVSCKQEDEDVIIIYTSDVHGYANENLGYAGVLSFKQESLKKTPYVTLIDAGDSISGSAYCQISKGEVIVECMNTVGYDYMAFGNHEFDYSIARCAENVEASNGQYLNSNIVYTGTSGVGDFINELPKYEIVEYGNLKVGYLAVDTPSCLTDTNPILLQEDGDFCMNFFFNDDASNFFNNIQKIIDELKEKGADKIICISHLGYGQENSPYSSVDLANSTYDIDVIVDGHAHVNIPSAFEKNLNGEEVVITSCGSSLECIGYITISANGTA